jgi:hypothetical protein
LMQEMRYPVISVKEVLHNCFWKYKISLMGKFANRVLLVLHFII